ncbi:formin-like protein 16 [Aquila chrysaetos chrysaetos]|uniref:formin-like protein 16 n=1 Tax=Aquila chrysaetos chrysaetos TaxID=223781 RepID=UPI0011765987|nr:formin-like protein 16 [Aquila chrysaetos chrysaetos]
MTGEKTKVNHLHCTVRLALRIHALEMAAWKRHWKYSAFNELLNWDLGNFTKLSYRTQHTPFITEAGSFATRALPVLAERLLGLPAPTVAVRSLGCAGHPTAGRRCKRLGPGRTSWRATGLPGPPDTAVLQRRQPGSPITFVFRRRRGSRLQPPPMTNCHLPRGRQPGHGGLGQPPPPPPPVSPPPVSPLPPVSPPPPGGSSSAPGSPQDCRVHPPPPPPPPPQRPVGG